MRTMLTLAALAAMCLPLSAQVRDDPDNKVEGGGTLPSGWQMRLDRPNAAAADVKLVTMGPGLHATLGPSGIFWQNSNTASGSYHAVATFTRTKAPQHPEAYGLFVGGKDLEGADQSYVYFLVRGDGSYLIKRRTGATTANISEGWTKSEAATTADESGKATDRLEILVQNGKAAFSINGTAVYSAELGNLDGITGLRVNHNLDVHIAGFGLHAM